MRRESVHLPPATLHIPRIIVASGMQSTGVTTIAELLQQSVSSLKIVDGGSQWVDILESCMPGFERIIVVTTHDIIAVSSAYALIKMIRDHFPGAPIEVLVNYSETRDALKTYERIQLAATHFLSETVGYAGSIPEHGLEPEQDHVGTLVGDSAILAIQNLALRLDEESSVLHELPLSRAVERRMIQ